MKGSTCHLLSHWFLARLILQPWRWRRHVPPKRRLTFSRLHSVISQKIELFVSINVGTVETSGYIEFYMYIYPTLLIVVRMCGDYYKRGIGLTTIIRRVLDWQLDLLDHTQLHTITVYTLYNSQQPSLFSCSEDPGSNCCNQLLWRPLPLVTNCSCSAVEY
jgi:hypothetical protein